MQAGRGGGIWQWAQKANTSEELFSHRVPTPQRTSDHSGTLLKIGVCAGSLPSFGDLKKSYFPNCATGREV